MTFKKIFPAVAVLAVLVGGLSACDSSGSTTKAASSSAKASTSAAAKPSGAATSGTPTPTTSAIKTTPEQDKALSDIRGKIRAVDEAASGEIAKDLATINPAFATLTNYQVRSLSNMTCTNKVVANKDSSNVVKGIKAYTKVDIAADQLTKVTEKLTAKFCA